MNTEQYLLIKVMEECAEVQKACAKALRFGLESEDPGNTIGVITNRMDIETEVVDLMVAIGSLEALGTISISETSDSALDVTAMRLVKYARISRHIGTLE